MITFTIFVKGYFSIIIMLTFLYLAGGLIRKTVSDSFTCSARNIFFNLVTGIICLISCYSIIMTRGITVSWLFPATGFLYLFHKNKLKPRLKREYESNKHSITTYIWLLLSWSTVIYTYLFISNCGFDGLYFRPVEGDSYFYAKLSTYLNKGYECSNFQAIMMGNSNLLPYHYGESWLTAFVYKFFALNPLYTYSVVIQSLALVVLLFGFLTVWEKKHSKISVCLTAGLIFLLFTTDMAYIYKEFISSEFLYVENRGYLFNMLKMSFLAIFFFAGIILLIEKNYVELFYSQLLILPLFFLASPAIGGLIGGGFIADYVKNKKLRWNYIIPFVIFLTAYLGYVITGISSPYSYSTGNNDILSSVPWYKLRLLITTPISYIALYFHLFLPVVLLCNIKRIINLIKKFPIPLLCFYLCTIIASVIARGVHRDAVQIISAIYPVILAVLFPSVILYYWDNIRQFGNTKKYMVYATMFISLSIGVYTINYLMSRKLYPVKESRLGYEKKVAELILTKKPLKIGVISDCPKYDFANNVIAYQTYLDAYYTDVTYYQLNIQQPSCAAYETLYSAGLKKSAMKEDDYRLKFVNDNHINYIMVRPDAYLPAHLHDYYDLMVRDETGESFYKRKS